MGKEPLKENTNVYFQARKRAAMSNDRLFSRENAAELEDGWHLAASIWYYRLW